MRYLIAVAAMAASLSAHAQETELRKCVGPKGHVTYTQSACPSGTKLHHSIYTAPEPVRSQPQWQQQLNAERAANEVRYVQPGPGAQGHRVAIAQDESACEIAKAYRNDVLNNVGLKRTVDLLRSLDDRVYAACK